MKRNILFVGVLVMAFVTIMGCQYGESTSDVEKVRRTTPSYTVSATTLVKEYENPAAGDLKYKDRVIVVTGKVESIGDAWLGSYTIMLGDRYSGVRCYFDETDDNRRQLAGLRVGSSVRVKGLCKGMLVGDVVLRGWSCPALVDSVALDS